LPRPSCLVLATIFTIVHCLFAETLANRPCYSSLTKHTSQFLVENKQGFGTGVTVSLAGVATVLS